MFKALVAALVLSPLVLLSACGGDGSKIKGSSYCVKNYAESRLNVDVVQGKKTKLTNETKLDLNEAQYKFNNGEIFVQDFERDITMHVSVTPQADGSTSVQLLCIGGTFGGEDPNKGINLKMIPFVVTVPVAGTLEIDKNKTSKIATGVITIDYRPRPGQAALQATYATSEQKDDKELKDIYQGFEDSKQFLYEFTNENLELRSSFKVAKGNNNLNKQSVIGLIRFEKVKAPETSK